MHHALSIMLFPEEAQKQWVIVTRPLAPGSRELALWADLFAIMFMQTLLYVQSTEYTSNPQRHHPAGTFTATGIMSLSNSLSTWTLMELSSLNASAQQHPMLNRLPSGQPGALGREQEKLVLQLLGILLKSVTPMVWRLHRASALMQHFSARSASDLIVLENLMLQCYWEPTLTNEAWLLHGATKEIAYDRRKKQSRQLDSSPSCHRP